MISSTSRTLLKLGSKCPEVSRLQQLLSQHVHPVSITGTFDYETELALKLFQSQMFLKPDGIVDFLTWQALCTDSPVAMPTLQQGHHGSAVESVQELLSIDMYYQGAVDGTFGAKTHQAVKRFQLDFSIPASGVVDARTWQALSQV